MKAIDLYKFITENNIEWHYSDNEGLEDVLIFPSIYEIIDLSKLLKSYISNDGLKCLIKNGYSAFWMNDVCEFYGIELSEVFNKNEDSNYN